MVGSLGFLGKKLCGLLDQEIENLPIKPLLFPVIFEEQFHITLYCRGI
jgi:hypothetical protein